LLRVSTGRIVLFGDYPGADLCGTGLYSHLGQVYLFVGSSLFLQFAKLCLIVGFICNALNSLPLSRV
jgi:hypothetical protein